MIHSVTCRLKKVKRIGNTLSFQCLLLLSAVLVVGCSSGNEANENGSRTPLRYSFWGTPEIVEIEEDLIATFEAENTDIDIIEEHVPATTADAYRMKILTGFAGSAAPDIIFIEKSQFKAFAARNAFLDLTPFIESEPDFPMDDFNPTILNAFTHDGKCYAIPRDIGTMALFYNVDMFEKAGLPFPPSTWDFDDWNWESFRKLTIALTKDFDGDGRTDQWGLVMGHWTDQWAPFIYQNGGDILLNKRCVLDSPQNIETMQFLSDLIHKDKVSPSHEDMVSNQGTNSLELFRSGKAAIFATGFWTNSSLFQRTQFRWDIAPYPEKKVKVTTWHGSALAICSQSKNPKEAWRFLKFTTQKEVQLRMASSGLLIPSRQSVALSEEFMAIPGLPKNMRVFIEGLKYARAPYIQEVPKLDYILNPGQAMSPIWSNRRPVGEVLSEITEEINSLIERNKVELY